MKIVFEHQGRKTTILGNDYVSIVEKIRLLFPNQNDRRIQFYDPELNDYFEFTSYEQIIDQPNGLKMNFDMSSISDSFCENIEPPSIPTYCDLIIQGLQSRAIQQEFLRQTCTYFLQQYPDSTSRKVHHSFIMALTQKFPALNFLDKSVDGVNGKAPYHTISRLLSRKKRNLKYSKSHPTPKCSRTLTLDSSSDNKTKTNDVAEETPINDAHSLKIDWDKNNFSNECSIEELINESFKNETLDSLLDPFEIHNVITPSPNTPIRPQILSKNDRQATISLVTPSTSLTQSTVSIINPSSISTTPVIVKPIITTNTPTNIIYHNGRMHITSLPSQSIVSVHKAIIPREKKENNNCQDIEVINTKKPDNIFKQSAIHNIEESYSTRNDPEILFPKLSNSEQNAYNTDVTRLRSIIKPKNKSSNNISIGKVHALIQNTHRIRRRLLGKEKSDFYMKGFQYQEMFHEEALTMEFMLLQNQILTWDEVQYKSRDLFDGLIRKYRIETQEKTSEADFSSVKLFCEAAQEHNLFFKNGLPNSHPMIGVIISSSSINQYEKAFIFIRNLPFKMPVSIAAGGLHKIFSLLLIIYINLNDAPVHTLLKMLFEQCNEKKHEQKVITLIT
ncbi:unnamed protein product [Rotaria sp. Silwood2]|nr:unnamed protein product [Rotaria sp. Silwood2]